MRGLLVFLSVSVLFYSSAAAETVWASWYGPGFHGNKTASGERFNKHAYTAAHRHLPFGTLVSVSYRGRHVVVRINDRGPFIRGRKLDLSQAAARKIRCAGVCKVKMKIIRKGRK